MAGDTADKQEEQTKNIEDSDPENEDHNEPAKTDEEKVETVTEETKTSINENLSIETGRNINNNIEDTKESENRNENNEVDNKEIKGNTKKMGPESKTSHYLQNIKNNSSAGLVLNEKDNKEATLLTDSKTVVRFSPVWRQVRDFHINK